MDAKLAELSRRYQRKATLRSVLYPDPYRRHDFAARLSAVGSWGGSRDPSIGK
jgi:hypothetical protein